MGPLRVTEALVDNLRDGSKVAIVSSRVGSIAVNGSGGNYGYWASKSAVNQIGMNLRHELVPRGIAVVLLHPGMVDRRAGDLSGRGCTRPIERIDALDMERSGSFWHTEGYELPW